MHRGYTTVLGFRLIGFYNKQFCYMHFKACFRSHTFHVQNLTQMSSNKDFRSSTLGSAHEKFGDYKWTLVFDHRDFGTEIYRHFDTFHSLFSS